MAASLYGRLREYSDSDYYGFHMPGHKRRSPEAMFSPDGGAEPAAGKQLPYGIDITEIEGFDDLHHARGILKEAQERAARVCGAQETHFLVNGSTVGILSAILGTTEKGDTVLVARNCHRSVYHAIYLNELRPVYLYPGFDPESCLNTEIDPQDVRNALERHPDIRAVILVSPTYDGVVSDVAAIAEAAHERGLPLIVDEAHGAHFGFHRAFPENSNRKGADVVIHSVHKTLPSLTQTALLHMNGPFVDRERVRFYLDMLQTSSPSYVLLASIDRCMELLESRREELFDPYVKELLSMRERLGDLKNLRLITPEGGDLSRLVISVRHAQITARELYETLLEEYHLQLEMAAGTYVLAMTGPGDAKEGMQRLTNTLHEIDNRIDGAHALPPQLPFGQCPAAETVYPVAEALRLRAGRRSLAWRESVGEVSAEYAYLYPPGCPLLVPGERITQEVCGLLEWYDRNGFSVEGLKRERYIEVLRQ